MRWGLGLLLVTTIAHADDRPAAPGTPPKLDNAPKDRVVLVIGSELRPLDPTITDEQIEMIAGDARLELALPKLAKGMYRGKTAKLALGKKQLTGSWIVEISDASPGYLKMPGACSGKIAATFAKDTYVVGTFAGATCWTKHDPR